MPEAKDRRGLPNAPNTPEDVAELLRQMAEHESHRTWSEVLSIAAETIELGAQGKGWIGARFRARVEGEKAAERTMRPDDFSSPRRVVELSQLPGHLHAVRFRNRPIAPIFVEFECGGKWYRTQVHNNDVAKEVIGKLWLQSHHEAGVAKNEKRRNKRKGRR